METEVIPRKRKTQKRKYHVDMTNDPQVHALTEKYSDKEKYNVTAKIEEKDIQAILKRYSHDLKIDLYTVAECFNISDHTLNMILKDEKYKSFFEACNYPRGTYYDCKQIDRYLSTDESYLVNVQVNGEWSEQSQFAVKHCDCLPCEIQSIVLTMSYEDGK